ncbi:MAG TPA: SIS domain-containing protein [Chloroflexota bacterium]|jgi:D-sedoheptulose 7-phosphate isomerase|nr:SIS domain-containing protein [Chloroflexota bacterium]
MARGNGSQPEQLDAETLFRAHVRATSALALQLATEAGATVTAMAQELIAVLRAGGKVLFCGNGGSAAQAQHLATELVSRYMRDRRPLPAIALTCDGTTLTAIANDYRFDDVFRRQVEALIVEGDLLVALTTSGNSPDVVMAAQEARRKKARVLALTGQAGGEIVKHSDLALLVPSVSTPLIQEMHLAVGHVLCDLVERALIASPETFGMGRKI